MGVENHRAFIALQNQVRALERAMTQIARIGDKQAGHILKLLEMLKATEARIVVLEGASGLSEEDLKRGYTKALERLDEVARDIQAGKEPPPFKEADFGEPQ